MVTRFGLRNELHGMPFRPRNYKLLRRLVTLLYGRPRGT
jgi:hypothetical protein